MEALSYQHANQGISSVSHLVLYFWPGACSIAAHIVLEETGLTFEAIKVDFAAGKQREPDYLAINPRGRVPALATPWGILTETPAILRYLTAAGTHPTPASRLWPTESRADARCSEWCSWLASTVHVTYAHISRAERYADSPEGKAEVVRKGIESCRPLWQEINDRLSASPWALGDTYSVVDPYLQVFWNWGRGQRLRYDMVTDFPAWTDHARRLAERPAVRRAFAREGLALPE